MDSIQAEKERAMRRYRRLRKIGALLRCLEAFAALLLLSWSSARLPAGFLRRLPALVLSPRFVFLLGNAIVLRLLAESGRLSPSSATSTNSSAPSSSSASSDLYEQLLETRGGRLPCSFPPPQEEVVYEDKAVCVETPVCPRSRSERVERRRRTPPELRRVETTGEAEEEEADAEEFRRAVEAFIAKQKECMAIVSAPLICSVGSPEQIILQK